MRSGPLGSLTCFSTLFGVTATGVSWNLRPRPRLDPSEGGSAVAHAGLRPNSAAAIWSRAAEQASHFLCHARDRRTLFCSAVFKIGEADSTEWTSLIQLHISSVVETLWKRRHENP